MTPRITAYNLQARIPADETPRKNAWEEACRIASWIHNRHPASKVLAYGSIIRQGAWNPRSDIDLAVSGIPNFSYKFAGDVWEAFPTYDVQVICLDERTPETDPEDPEAENFHAEVVRSAIEIPAPFPMSAGNEETHEISRRLESVIRRAEAELKKMQQTVELAASDKNAEILLLSAVRYEAMRYRTHIERGLSRVLGYIDRLARDPELEEGDERLRLYLLASQDISGLRPALIPEHVAVWHSQHVEREYALLDKAEEKEISENLLRELPAIHLETKRAFDAFCAFLQDESSAKRHSERQKRIQNQIPQQKRIQNPIA